jgi:four helix bundle protein
VSKDFKFCDQIRDSSASATRNMAEGFGRYWPADFAKFLTIARASLMETHNCAGSGYKKVYFTAENTDKMQRLAARSGKAATRLIEYLRACRSGSQRGPRTKNPSNH